jgi:hypothetical protein
VGSKTAQEFASGSLSDTTMESDNPATQSSTKDISLEFAASTALSRQNAGKPPDPAGLVSSAPVVNSVAYWDERFLSDWVAMGGRKQTSFFAEIICRNLPRMVADDIRLHDFSIFDVGCALGDALPILQTAFPTSKVSGGDASTIAVAIARTLYSDFEFIAFNELQNKTEPIGRGLLF